MAGAVAVVAAILLGVPADAGAISKGKADGIAVKELKVKKLGEQVVLFAEPKALKKGTVVGEAGVQGEIPSGPVVLKGTKLKKKAYLYWLDREYGALFQHMSTMLLIDAKSGKVIKRQNLLWWPLVNGKPPAYMASADGYRLAKLQVYAGQPQVISTDATPDFRPPARARSPRLPPAGTFAQDCMVMIGDRLNPTFQGNFTAMKKWADKVGLQTSNAINAEDLGNDVNDFIAHGCKDVFIYVAGHGVAPDGWVPPAGFPPGQQIRTGPAAVALGSKFDLDPKTGKTTWTPQSLTPADLDKIYKANPKITFKTKIDACFAGRFKSLIANKNLRVLELSSAEDQTSQGYLGHWEVKHKNTGKIVKWSTVADNPDGATEFTNGDIHGLTAWGESSAEMSQHPGLAGAIERSLDLGKAYNITFGTIPKGEPGHTDPEVHTNPPIPQGAAPTANFGFAPNSPPSAPKKGQTVTFNGNGSTDPDGDIRTYEWDFGDGTPHGFGPDVTHTFTQPGIYNVKLTVTDSEGNTNSVTEPVKVSGAGSKPATFTDIPCSSGVATGGSVDINIPTFAEGANMSVTSPLNCPGGRSITNLVVSTVMGPAPLTSDIDAWGMASNHLHADYDLTGPDGGGTGSATFTAAWS